MQAVLTVAGQSSRLYPYGGQKHKSTITLLGKPLIVHTIEALVKIGVNDVVIVDSPNNGVREAVEKAELPLAITFVSHIGARGMGEAILDARKYLQKKFLLVHAHHVDAQDHLPQLINASSDDEVSLLIKKEHDLSAYGVVKLDGEIVTELVEKPNNPEAYEYRVVGMYGLNEHFLDTLEKTEKHHYSFEDAICSMIQEKKVKVVKTDKNVLSLKYPFHLFDIVSYLFESVEKHISQNASIDETAKLDGKVIVDDDVKVYEHAVIKGPVYLGKGVVIGNNAIVREGVSIEKSSKIGANMEVKHSIIQDNTTTHSGFLGDSILGANSKLAALFCSGNVRLDRKNIKVEVKGHKVDSGLNHLGTFIGDNVRIGIRVSTMPGVVIGNNAVIGPQTVVFRNVDEGVSFYSTFTDVVVKEHEKEHVEKANEKQTVILFDIDYTLFDTAKFKESELSEYILYDEVIEVLETLGGIVKLGIFSEGDLDFQKTKLVTTLIHEHFAQEHIHIVADKTATIASVLKKYRDDKLILVDDKLEVLKMAKGLSQNVYTIWVKRGPFAESADESIFIPNATVARLDELIKIVSNI